MIPVNFAIYRVRRDITLGLLLKAAMIAAIFGCLLFAPLSMRFASLAGVVAIWIALSITSARTSRLGADSPALIATGQYDEAEQQIDQMMRGFSMFGPVKLRALHQLAVLRHAQQRWPEAAALSRALLRHRLGSADGLMRPSRLILVESLLELNDLPGSYEAIHDLYRQRLSLREMLNLAALQIDYESRIGAWQAMFTGVVTKVQLAELMPAGQSARTQALLALAADKVGRADWAQWLRHRAELLADVARLTADRPMLGEVWKTES